MQPGKHTQEPHQGSEQGEADMTKKSRAAKLLHAFLKREVVAQKGHCQPQGFIIACARVNMARPGMLESVGKLRAQIFQFRFGHKQVLQHFFGKQVRFALEARILSSGIYRLFWLQAGSPFLDSSVFIQFTPDKAFCEPSWQFSTTPTGKTLRGTGIIKVCI